jgi:hypothetical protein
MGFEEANARRCTADPIELFDHFTTTVGTIRQIDDPDAVE